MTETAVYLQPAFILQHRNYRETSIILDVLTKDYGRISLLAKGVRKAKSKIAGVLQPFMPLLLSYFGKGELKILNTAEISQPFVKLTGIAVYCGFYVNELVGCFLHKDDPHPEVFMDYQACLLNLSGDTKIEIALRIFEVNLMHNVGYGLELQQDDVVAKTPFNTLKQYQFSRDLGLIETENGPFSGITLQAIKARDFTDAKVMVEAKLLMRTVIDSHLLGRTLKSRSVINNVIKYIK